MKELLAKLLERKNLSQEEAREMILWVMSEEAVPTQAAALLALRRTAVAFFRSHSSKSKYALHLLLDLITELPRGDLEARVEIGELPQAADDLLDRLVELFDVG